MMRISSGGGDLSDSSLRRAIQLGVDCIDLGCPPLDQLTAVKKRIRSFGLDVNRISLPDMSAAFMRGEEGSEKELDTVERTLRAFGDAGYRLTFQRFEGSNFNHLATFYESVHRGGYRGSGKSVRPPERPEEELRRARIAYWPHFGHDEPPDRAELDAWWGRFCRVFERLVPIAEEYEMRIGVHPADLPLADAPFGTLGFHRGLIEAVAAQGFTMPAGAMGLGRSMKLDRQQVVALTVAVERWFATDHAARFAAIDRRLAVVEQALRGLPHVQLDPHMVTHGFYGSFLVVGLDTAALGRTAPQIAEELYVGEPSVLVQSPTESTLWVFFYTVEDGEECIIADRLRAVLHQ